MQEFYDTLAVPYIILLSTTVDDIRVCIAYFHDAGTALVTDAGR